MHMSCPAQKKHRRKVRALYLLYKIYHRADPIIHEYLYRFVAAHNIRASAALDELISMIPRCRSDKFRRSFRPAAVRPWNSLPLGDFSGDTLSSFKSVMNLCLQMA